MGLDIALVDRLGLELTLDHHVGLGEAFVDVAPGEGDALCDVGRLIGLRVEPVSAQVVVQDRRIVPHRLVDVDDVLDMHEFLNEFDGNFLRLFNGRP
jgi:hypothetical protein